MWLICRLNNPNNQVPFPRILQSCFSDLSAPVMDHVRKTLKAFGSKQQEEKEALLHHHDDEEIEEIAVKIDTDVSSSDIAAKSSGESSSNMDTWKKKPKVSFEQVLKEVVQLRSKECYDQEKLPSALNASFQESSWRSLVKKTKSRLADPPESVERYQRSNCTSDNEGFGGDYTEADIEDIPEEYKQVKFSKLSILQGISLILVIVALLCSLSIPVIKRQKLWDLPLWKWELMVMAVICGRLVSDWIIKIVVFFIERNFVLRKRVLYFVYGLKRAVKNCLWVGLVLIVWNMMFDERIAKETNSKMLPYATKILLCFLAASLIWFLKTLLVKVLASSFHVNTFFDRIQEALFNQYVIETLSGPPLFETNVIEDDHEPSKVSGFNHSKSMPNSGDIARNESDAAKGKLQNLHSMGTSRVSKTTSKKKHYEIRIHLHKLNQTNISAWNMKRMIDIIRHGNLSTLEEQLLDSKIEDEALLHIRSECQAKEAAKKIFQKVAKTDSQHIFLDDIMRFLGKEEALKAMHQFGASCENEGITKSSLNNWLVNAFRERRALALSLNDTKTAVDQLHNMLNIIVVIVIIIVWLMILGFPVTNFLVFISSQLLLLAFIFGNSCITAFEAMIFLFIMHPFDVGDRCEIDGIVMVVEEMNILTTVFLRHDQQKIIYPNSVLTTKPIGNFYRSPHMVEDIDFSVHITTPMEKIALMKERIKRYVEGNKEHWHPAPQVVVTDVENMDRIKISVWLTHRMNYQEMAERLLRRALVVEEMIKVFKELDIEFRMLPLDVNLRNFPPIVSDRLPSNWTTSAN